MFDLKNKLNLNVILPSNTDATPTQKQNQHFDLKIKDLVISKNLLLLLDIFNATSKQLCKQCGVAYSC